MAFRTKLLIAAACAAFALAAPASAEDIARGEVLYGLCTQCHGDAGQGSPLALAPAIGGLADWYVESQLQNFKKGVRGMHPDDLGGLRMYPMSLFLRSDEDIASVSAYVASLPTPPVETTVDGNATKGAEYYATCTQCHGANGGGNQQLNAPRLTGTSDWYLVESLKKYKAGIRGGNPGNANAVLMRGMSNMLVDDQAINDVVAHIVTLAE